MTAQSRSALNTTAMVFVMAISLCSCGKSEFAANSSEDSAKAPSVDSASAIEPTPSLIARRPRRGAIDLANAEKRAQADDLLKQYPCATTQCASESLGASNPAEAMWLKRRGFPTPTRAADLENMSLGELQMEADKGDFSAQAVLGRRLMEQGNKMAGLTRLAGAAAQGSVFADYQLSLGERNSNIIESAAYLRRAYLQGDVKAATVMYQAFPKFSAVEWQEVDRRATQLYSSLLSQRANKGQMPYGPRPQ